MSSEPPDTITAFGTEYRVENGHIDISLRLTCEQAKRIDENATEAMNLQEACRMLIEQALQARARQLTREDLYRAFSEAVAPIAEAIRETERDRE